MWRGWWRGGVGRWRDGVWMLASDQVRPGLILRDRLSRRTSGYRYCPGADYVAFCGLTRSVDDESEARTAGQCGGRQVALPLPPTAPRAYGHWVGHSTSNQPMRILGPTFLGGAPPVIGECWK